MKKYGIDWWLMLAFWRIFNALDWLASRMALRPIEFIADRTYLLWARRCYEPRTDFSLDLAERDRGRRKRSRA